MVSTIAVSDGFQAFVLKAKQVFPWATAVGYDARSVRTWRRVAMTVAEEDHKIHRFRFISLLNMGAGTALLVVPFGWLISRLPSDSLGGIQLVTIVGRATASGLSTSAGRKCTL